MTYNIKDTVRMKGTDITGIITDKFSDTHYKVKFGVYGAPVTMRDSELELINNNLKENENEI